MLDFSPPLRYTTFPRGAGRALVEVQAPIETKRRQPSQAPTVPWAAGDPLEESSFTEGLHFTRCEPTLTGRSKSPYIL